MAQRTETILTCDLCPEPGQPVLATYTFSVGSAEYETELCAEHKVSFDEIMAPYREHARRTAGRYTGVKRDRKSDAMQFRRAARLWGIANGKPVSAMGRIPAAVLTDYQEYLDSQSA